MRTITRQEDVTNPISVFPHQTFTYLLESEIGAMEEDMGSLPFTALDLVRQCYLNVGRYKAHELSPELIKREIRNVGEAIYLRRQGLPNEISNSLSPHILLKSSKVRIVNESLAHLIQQTHHYLGSPRTNSLHLGLFAPSSDLRGENLLAIGTFSEFDLTHMSNLIPTGIENEQVLVLSRFYAFNGCPPNTPSFALSRMLDWLQSSDSTLKMILSYLNPNLGFKGTIYRASNWHLIGLERKERYLYLDDNYVTDRYMIDSFGTAKFRLLKSILGNRLKQSNFTLLPLEVYGYTLDLRLRKQTLRVPVQDFAPNPKLV